MTLDWLIQVRHSRCLAALTQSQFNAAVSYQCDRDALTELGVDA